MTTVASIEDVLLRLAFTEDAALQPIIEKLLPALLSNVTVEDTPVRAKVQHGWFRRISKFETSSFACLQVIEALSHMTKRIRAMPILKLPIADLLAVREPANAVQLGLVNVFLSLAFARVAPAELDTLAPLLLTNVQLFSSSHKALCMRLFMKVACFEPPCGLSTDNIFCMLARGDEHVCVFGCCDNGLC